MTTDFHFKFVIPSLLVVICSHAILVHVDRSMSVINGIYNYCFMLQLEVLSKCRKQELTLLHRVLGEVSHTSMHGTLQRLTPEPTGPRQGRTTEPTVPRQGLIHSMHGPRQGIATEPAVS